jgi:predicted membrane-bound spermidine synthase
LLILVQFRLNELPPDLIKLIFMSLIVCCGYLVGAEFSVAAGQAQKAGLAAQRTGGLIYAADLLGAWLGGLTITAVFVPAVGIPQTLLLLIVLKLLTSVFYWVVHIPSRA